jgi:polysaccharide biosynthesis transport protein
MKSILRSIASWYPGQWRERHGPEIDYFIEASDPKWTDCTDLLKGVFAMRFRNAGQSWGTAIALMVLGGLVGTAAAILLPRSYISSAVIEAHTSRVSNVQFADAFSRKAITAIIKQQNLYGADRQRQPLEDVVENMKRHISVSLATRGLSATQGGTVAVQLAFEYAEPEVAQRVNKALIARLQEAVQGDAAISGNTLRVIDPASLPSSPAHPNVPNCIATGAIVGLIAGVIIVAIAKMKKGPRHALPPSTA